MEAETATYGTWPRRVVIAGDGTVVTARMPTRAEANTLGISIGIPVIAVTVNGGTEQLYNANETEVLAK